MVGISAGVLGEDGVHPPGVELTVGWDIDLVEVTVTRREPDRAYPVRGGEPLVLGDGVTTATLVDYECPFGVPVTYEVSCTAQRSAYTSATVRLDPTAWYPNNLGWSTTRGAVWLRHPAIPALSTPIDLSDADTPTTAQTRSVQAVLNRASPIVLTDGRRKNPTTTLHVRTWSLEEGARLTEILADNSPLLLTVPAGERWGIGSVWVTVGDATEERLVQEWAPHEGRVWHLPVDIVDRPAGGVVYPDVCYWSVRRTARTYTHLRARYTTYADLLAGNAVPE